MAHILVVDDEAGITTVIKEMLTRLNYNVLTARTGKEALEKLSLGPVDLLITDIIMPDMDGLQLITEIQHTRPQVKIIAMSGGGDKAGPEGYLKAARQLGAAYYIAKPFMLNQLATLVAKALAEPSRSPAAM